MRVIPSSTCGQACDIIVTLSYFHQQQKKKGTLYIYNEIVTTKRKDLKIDYPYKKYRLMPLNYNMWNFFFFFGN